MEKIEFLRFQLRMLEARYRQQANYTMNASMHLASVITMAEINEVKEMISEEK